MLARSLAFLKLFFMMWCPPSVHDRLDQARLEPGWSQGHSSTWVCLHLMGGWAWSGTPAPTRLCCPRHTSVLIDWIFLNYKGRVTAQLGAGPGLLSAALPPRSLQRPELGPSKARRWSRFCLPGVPQPLQGCVLGALSQPTHR